MEVKLSVWVKTKQNVSIKTDQVLNTLSHKNWHRRHWQRKCY